MRRKNKKNVGIIFFVILVIQIFAFNYFASIYKGFVDNHNKLQQSQVSMNNTLIADTVREQQKNTLMSTKQSWMKYLEQHPEISLMKRIDGKLVYKNTKEFVLFNEETMYITSVGNDKFDIRDKETDERLIANAQPEWDDDEVERILNVLVKPIKMFGNNGGIVVYDTNTGRVLLDTTSTQRLLNGKQYSIFKDYENAKNKNPLETKEVINNYFKVKKDSNRTSSIVYMFNESTSMENDANDFVKYPLGNYNRQFIESTILPYESIGFEGQPLQLTMLSVVDEQDLSGAYKDILKEISDSLQNNIVLYKHTAFVLFLSILCTMISMLVMLYSLYKDTCKNE